MACIMCSMSVTDVPSVVWGGRATCAAEMGAGDGQEADSQPEEETSEAEADSLLLLVDFDDHAANHLALLEDLVGVGDLLGPGDVRDVEQTVDARLDLDERAVVGEVPDRAFDDRAGGVLLGDEFPGVDLDLLHAQGDLELLLVDVKDDDFDLVTD